MNGIQRIWLFRCGSACTFFLGAGGLGCASFPGLDLQVSPAMLDNRELQTRVFEIGDEGKMLSACAALLQDTGFIIEESDPSTGLITASKTREASAEAKEVAMITAVMIIGTAMGDPSALFAPLMRTTELTIEASVTTRLLAGNRIDVRVMFRRTLLNSEQEINDIEILTEPEVYKEFFSRLSKAVFLEDQEI